MANSKRTILAIDDDTDLLRLLSIRLSTSGYAVITTTTAEEALDLMAEAQPHLVISDLHLPGIDGLALLEVIHSIYPAIPVILLTADGSINNAVKATTLGAFCFLTKPYDSHELLAQVKDGVSKNAIFGLNSLPGF